MKRVIAVIVIALASVFALSACTQSDVEDLKGLTDIRYTGDVDTDLKSLCHIGSVVTKANNNANIQFNEEVNKQVAQFAEQSDDERVKSLAKGVSLATSLDETSRRAGEQMIKDTCASI